MATDVLQRPDGSLDTWIYPPDHGLVLVAPHTNSQYKTSSPVFGKKRIDRPKSVPITLAANSSRGPSLQSNQSTLCGATRPKTAVGYSKADYGPYSCSRVQQIEPTRKHALESHLPVRKNKPPPWQRALDSSPVPCLVSPAYTLSRSKSKVSMTINTDNFFDSEFGDNESVQKEVVRLQKSRRDPLVDQLQQQIDDLTLYLEEERLNHRDTRRQAAERLHDRTEEMSRQHQQEMRMMEEDYLEQMQQLKDSNQRDMDNLTGSSEQAMAKMHGETEFLQAAFESYKTQLHMETDERWNKRQAELQQQQEETLNEKLKQLRSKVQSERSAEKMEITQAHQRELLNIKQEHKKEINQLIRRYSNAAKDLEDYQKTQAELSEKCEELEKLKLDYDDVCKQVTSLTRRLTDVKVELVAFEQTFQDRVQGIDDKYKDQIHGLMTQNTELRRLYVKKCGQLFDEKVECERQRENTLITAKDAMKVPLTGKSRAEIVESVWSEIDCRLAAGDQ